MRWLFVYNDDTIYTRTLRTTARVEAVLFVLLQIIICFLYLRRLPNVCLSRSAWLWNETDYSREKRFCYIYVYHFCITMFVIMFVNVFQRIYPPFVRRGVSSSRASNRYATDDGLYYDHVVHVLRYIYTYRYMYTHIHQA